MSYRTQSLIKSNIELPSIEKKLSICLKSNGFSFSVISTQDILLAIGDVEHISDEPYNIVSSANEVRSYFTAQNIPFTGYSQVKLIVPSVYGVWVPDELYDESKQRQYLNIVGYKNTDLGITAVHNSTIMSQMVFSYNINTVAPYKVAFPGLIITNQHNALVNDYVRRWASDCPMILLNLRDNYMDIVVFVQSKLQLSTTYEVSSVKDVVMRTIDVMKRLNIEQPNTQLQLCGDVSRDIYAVFRDYFPIVRLYTGRPLRFGAQEMQQVHSYKYPFILS